MAISQKTIDKYINKKFNKLLVTDVFHQHNGKRNILFLKCECECGQHTETRASDVTTGSTKSCGCAHKDAKLIVNQSCKEKYDGMIFENNNGEQYEIINYINNSNVYIRFLITNNVERVHISHVHSGEIRNYFTPNKNGGYMGKGVYKANSTNYIVRTAYSKWRWMFDRCYNEDFHRKQPTYKDCVVSAEWENFQNFAEWITLNWYDCSDSLELDKDLLVEGNKIYSPDTCCLIPRAINQALAQKRHDKDYMTEIYYKYRDILPQYIKDKLLDLTNYERKVA